MLLSSYESNDDIKNKIVSDVCSVQVLQLLDYFSKVIFRFTSSNTYLKYVLCSNATRTT